MSHSENKVNDGDDMIVIMRDRDGNEYSYKEEMILPVNGEFYAVLSDDEPESKDDAFIARIEKDEQGEDVYVTDLTEDELAMVQKAYDELADDLENAD